MNFLNNIIIPHIFFRSAQQVSINMIKAYEDDDKKYEIQGENELRSEQMINDLLDDDDKKYQEQYEQEIKTEQIIEELLKDDDDDFLQFRVAEERTNSILHFLFSS
jgi:hypothetical protein